MISGCTLIPKKSSQSEVNQNTNLVVETNVNVNNEVSTTTSKKNQEDQWVLYTNTRYGLQFNYPDHWAISGNSDTGVYQLLENKEWGGASGGIFIKPIAKQSAESLLVDLQKRAEQSRQYYQEHPDGPATKYSEPELITLAGETVIKQVYQPYEISPSGAMYFFPQKGVELDLTDLFGDGENSENYTKIVHEKILASFKFLGKLNYLGYGYYTDGKGIYYVSLERNQNVVRKINSGDIVNFDYFDEKNRYLFIESAPYELEGVDINSFVTLNTFCGMGHCEGVAKDNNYIYVGVMPDDRLKNADVKTFQYLKYNFYKDKNALYYYGMGWGRADYVDLATFEFIDPMYSKDKNNVYQFMDGFNIVKGADPKTFVVPKY